MRAVALIALLTLAPGSARGDEGEKVTFDVGGSFSLSAFRNFGGVNRTDLPTFAAPSLGGAATAGVSARQSRLRLGVNLPASGLLSSAKLDGQVEVDFMGALALDGPALPSVRLREAWLTARFPGATGATVLLGHTARLFGGPTVPVSLAHLAVPRFVGAGVLSRRAPQVRASVDVGAPFAFGAQAAVLAPSDATRSQGVYVGERSGLPDLEARVAGLYRPGGKRVAELGLSGRAGQELFFLDGLAAPRDERIASWGVAADFRVEVPYVLLQGAAYTGEALSALSTAAPGVNIVPDATDAALLDGVSPVRTSGVWAQAVISATGPLSVLLGLGVERPDEATLPSAVDGASPVARNVQLSGGGIVALTRSWKVSVEGTWFQTRTLDGWARNSTQLELASLYEF